MKFTIIAAALLSMLQACSCAEEPAPAEADAGTVQRRGRADAGIQSPDAGRMATTITVRVTIDGEAAAGARVSQGGTGNFHETDAEGRAQLTLDPHVVGDLAVVASHQEARTAFIPWPGADDGEAQIAMSRYDTTDNPHYRFQDPGEPERRASTAECGHCHRTINDAWFGSAHRRSASNPAVHDVYAGTAHSLTDEASCAAAGGRWQTARRPGGGEAPRCFVGGGLLGSQAGCADASCLEGPAARGRCADCHAPTINGELGGRDLLEAEDLAYDYGVSCDLCHRVESIEAEQPAGVAGRLHLHRPSEEGAITLGAGGLLPITFGPSHDSPNVRMGSVQRDHFRSGELCSGCHQYDQRGGDGLPAPTAERWPDGKLPVHSTFQEWRDGPYADAAACNACHMPPDADVLNGADHQLFPEAETGLVAGWIRPPGAVRQHSWVGPRHDQGGILELAASLNLVSERRGEGFDVTVTTTNSGCGHALPTGEPQRQVLMVVTMRCGEQAIPASGGAVIASYGGAVETRGSGDDWRRWQSAQIGDKIRVIRTTNRYRDYDGFGAFAGANWSAEAKGIGIEEAVGSVTVTGLVDGQIETDGPLPTGDRAYLIRGDQALAGEAGVGFARLLKSADGRTGVHHSEAVDIVSDNRLMPSASWTSNHRFPAACENPSFRARLIHRNAFYEQAKHRAWTLVDRPMTETVR